MIQINKKAFNESNACVFTSVLGNAVIYLTMPKVAGGKKGLAALESALGATFDGKLTMVHNARSYNYENGVNNEAEREGLERTFEAQSLRGKHHVARNVLASDKDESVKYLALTWLEDGATTFESIFIVGGKVASEKQVELIKAALYVSPNAGSSQPTERKVGYCSPKFDNIVWWGKTDECRAYMAQYK